MRTLISLLCVVAPSLVITSTLSPQKIPDPKKSELEIQLHDIGALVRTLDRGEEVDVRNGALEEFEEWGGGSLVASELAEMARQFIEPALRDGEDVRPLGGDLLAARLRPVQQAWLHAWLKRLRSRGTRQFDVTAHFLNLSSGDHAQHIAPLLTDGGRVPDRVAGGAGGWLVSAKAVDKALEDSPTLVRTETPRLLTYEMTRASMSMLRNRGFVRTYAQHPKTQDWTPVFDACRGGVAVDVRGTLLPDGSHGLTLRPSWLRILEMRKDFMVRAGRQLPIEIPDLDEWQPAIDVRLPEGKVAVFSKPPTKKGQPHRLIVVRSQVVK